MKNRHSEHNCPMQEFADSMGAKFHWKDFPVLNRDDLLVKPIRTSLYSEQFRRWFKFLEHQIRIIDNNFHSSDGLLQEASFVGIIKPEDIICKSILKDSFCDHPYWKATTPLIGGSEEALRPTSAQFQALKLPEVAEFPWFVDYLCWSITIGCVPYSMKTASERSKTELMKIPKSAKLDGGGKLLPVSVYFSLEEAKVGSTLKVRV